MNLLKTILSIIGGVVILGFVFAFFKFDLGTRMGQASKLDPQAMNLYIAMADSVLTTGNAAESMTRRVKIDEDVSTEDVIDALNSIATEDNLIIVGTSLMSNGKVDANGVKQPYIRLMSYCNPNIAKQFISYSMAFGAFMPCRVAIIEDKNGDRWLYTMALEMMISGGHTLPPKLLTMANNVKKTMYRMMELAAKGEF